MLRREITSLNGEDISGKSMFGFLSTAMNFELEGT
jgi:hypothetical protein